MYDRDYFENVIARLRAKGIRFASGLSDAEISEREGQFDFTFPPDLRHFLQAALPISSYFVDWRSPLEKLREWFDQPIEGVLFDVRNTVFWYPEWGVRPDDNSAAVELAKQHLSLVPKLIPIGDPVFTKCIPATPSMTGNPVFSVHQTDIVHAGRNLADLLYWFSRPQEEFDRDEEEGTTPTSVYSQDYRPIEFWTELVRLNSVD